MGKVAEESRTCDETTSSALSDSAIQPNRCILVVDDEPIARTLLNNILFPHYTVVDADDGIEALKVLHTQTISLVLSDAVMPNMTGLELLRAMKDDPDLNSIPRMLVTADGNTSTEIKALELGASDVIRKPYVAEVLLGRVHNLFNVQDAIKTKEQNKLFKLRLEQQDALVYMMEHDELTGLLNRQAFCHRVGSFLENTLTGTFRIVRADLDSFSSINDLFGTANGDALLRDIGHEMMMHQEDNFICGHISADHFAIFMEASLISPEDLLLHMQNWLDENEGKFKARCRIGIYPINNLEIDPALMLDRALLALHSTKENFTERIGYYDTSMRLKIMDEQKLSNEMIPALEAHQFEIYYQPQVDYDNGRIVGAEALVRWNHPTRGILSPASFLPLFESNGQITQLDNYVWEETCRQLHDWIDRLGDRMCPISVNISRIDVLSEDLCSRLKTLISRYRIPVNMLHVEITESACIENTSVLCSVVESLSAEGFTVEMDDFGSAYSSLNTLKDIEVDVLKLDMKFLSDTQNTSRGGNILSSVVRMARWLKLPIIAEGIETKPQADYLLSIGCSVMQGYYFSRPVPAADFEAQLHKRETGTLDQYKNVDFESAENFWDASTQTALIFNSFVGGAIILERAKDGNLELLRANDRFFEVLHTDRKTYEPFMLHMNKRFGQQTLVQYNAMLDEAAKTHRESSYVLQSKPLPGGSLLWTRSVAKIIADSADNQIFYVSVENVTEQKKTELKLACCEQRLNLLESDDTQNQAAALASSDKVRDRYRVIVDETGAGVFEWDRRKNTFFESDAMKHYALCKVDPIEAFRNKDATFAHYSDRPIVQAFYRLIEEGKPSAQMVVRLKMVNGHYQWTRVTSDLSYDVEGRCTRVVGVLMDVDEECRSKERLKLASSRLRNIVANLPGGIAILHIEPSGTISPAYFSEKACDLFGASDESAAFEVLSRSRFCSLVRSHAVHDANSPGGKSDYMPLLHITRENKPCFWMRAYCRFISTPDGCILCYAAFFDETANVEAEQDAESVNELYGLLIENTDTITFDYSIAKKTLLLSYIDPKSGRVEMMLKDYFKDLKQGKAAIDEQYRNEVLAAYDNAVAEATRGSFDFHGFGPDHKPHWFHVKYSSLADTSGCVHRIIGRLDKYDRIVEEYQAQIERIRLDKVSGLLGKDSARIAVDNALMTRPEKRLDAMLFVDIDNFKRINDTVGHMDADHILHQIGALLKKTFRKDDITSRFGGDEFLVYMKGIGSIQISENKAGSLLCQMAQIEFGEGEKVACSIGIVGITGENKSFDEVFRKVDKALYESKLQGKNRYTVYCDDV